MIIQKYLRNQLQCSEKPRPLCPFCKACILQRKPKPLPRVPQPPIQRLQPDLPISLHLSYASPPSPVKKLFPLLPKAKCPGVPRVSFLPFFFLSWWTFTPTVQNLPSELDTSHPLLNLWTPISFSSLLLSCSFHNQMSWPPCILIPFSLLSAVRYDGCPRHTCGRGPSCHRMSWIFFLVSQQPEM